MHKTFAQIHLSATIVRSGMTDAALASVLGVNQSTISRLKNGKILKVNKYQRSLDEHLGVGPGGRTEDLSELFEMAESSPTLRGVLTALQHFMREIA